MGGYGRRVSSVERHDDVIEVNLGEANADAREAEALLSDIADEFERNGPVRQLLVRVIGAPRGMGTIVRSLAAEAGRRNVSLKWRL